MAGFDRRPTNSSPAKAKTAFLKHDKRGSCSLPALYLASLADAASVIGRRSGQLVFQLHTSDALLWASPLRLRGVVTNAALALSPARRQPLTRMAVAEEMCLVSFTPARHYRPKTTRICSGPR